MDDEDGESVAGDMVDGLDIVEEGDEGRVCGKKVRTGGGGGRREVDEMIWIWSVSIYKRAPQPLTS